MSKLIPMFLNVTQQIPFTPGLRKESNFLLIMMQKMNIE